MPAFGGLPSGDTSMPGTKENKRLIVTLVPLAPATRYRRAGGDGGGRVKVTYYTCGSGPQLAGSQAGTCPAHLECYHIPTDGPQGILRLPRVSGEVSALASTPDRGSSSG